jgi:prepilin-type N-terminal cleavage/methylation domain-containing protein
MKAMRASSAAGFTLIEMVVTLGVFVLLAGSVFGILSAVLQSSTRLADDQRRQDEATALEGYLQHRFQRVADSAGVLFTYRRDAQDGARGLIFSDGNDLVALNTGYQANGYRNLRQARFVPPPDVAGNAQAGALLFERFILRGDDSIVWRPLLGDLRQIDWKFRLKDGAEWVEDLLPSQTPPSLVEMTLEIAGDLRARTADFWMPPVEPVAWADGKYGGFARVL